MSDPYSDFKDESVPSNLMRVLESLADEQQEAEAEVLRLERELKSAQDVLKDIVENKIPNAAEGLSGKFKLNDGREIEVGEKIRASIAGEKRVPAIRWLDDNDYGHIVKRQLVFEFGKGQDDKVRQFIKAMRDWEAVHGDTLNMKENYTVHHATLESWVREQLAEGVDLPRETFGIFRQRFSKVKD